MEKALKMKRQKHYKNKEKYFSKNNKRFGKYPTEE